MPVSAQSNAGSNAVLLARLQESMGPQVAEQALNSIARLRARCERRSPTECQILLPFGGGKDSAWTLAYVRLMQLLLVRKHGRTFRLHVLLMVHPGIPPGVFENLENVFGALEINASRDVQVFATSLGGASIEPRFGTLRSEVVELFRQEILLSGHLSQGNGRETFCNGCNFTLMNAIARYVSSPDYEIDFVITGDSSSEVTSYWKWVQKTSSLFSLDRIDRRKASWSSLFGKLSEINRAYYRSLLGPRAVEAGSPYEFPNVDRPKFAPPEYFRIFDETSYEFWSHESFMNDFLGFELREDAFNFTESDCRNPMLMAHLRGLLADFEGRGYLTGVREYLGLVTGLMNRKSYSDDMIELALHPYRDDGAILERRRKAELYAAEQFDLTPKQLEGMVASPLVDRRARLEPYLRWSHPQEIDRLACLDAFLGELARLAARQGLEGSADRVEIATNRLVQSGAFGHDEVAGSFGFLSESLGLSLGSLCLLLSRNSASSCRTSGSPPSELEILRQGDPHQTKIEADPGCANTVITGR